MENLSEALAAEFPPSSISWRAQTLTQDGKKALALAYIDARDVMERLDEVCGVAGWQCEYPHANGKTICSIGILIDGQWIWKADGAGDTDIEASKGAISDAFKRAAVKWGIGRYLYDLGATWVPCESYEKNGKKYWKSFTDDPWKYVDRSPFKTATARKNYCETLFNGFQEAGTEKALLAYSAQSKQMIDKMKVSGNEHDYIAVTEIRKRYGLRLEALKKEEKENKELDDQMDQRINGAA